MGAGAGGFGGDELAAKGFGVDGLREDALEAEAELLGFDDAEDAALVEEGVVGGAVGGGVFLDGGGGDVFAEAGAEGARSPTGGLEAGVHEALADGGFGGGRVAGARRVRWPPGGHAGVMQLRLGNEGQ